MKLNVTLILTIVLIIVSSTFRTASGLDVPQEYRKFIIDRPENRDGFVTRLCKSFDICSSMKFDRSVALLVNVSKYKHLPVLQSTDKDAERMKNFLLESKEFDQVVLLTDDDASFGVINYFMEDYFPQILRAAGKSRFLFYFSGHGQSIDNGDGSFRGYLRLVNNRPDAFSDSIRMDTVAHWAQENTIRATHSLFIIDSCVSGLVIPERKQVVSSIARNPLELARYSEGSIITAGAAGDDALADAKWQGSLFTYALLQALTKETLVPGSEDGLISSYQLFDFVHRFVSSESKNKQTPRRYEFRKEKNGDFFFLSPKAPTIVVKKGSPELTGETKGSGQIDFEPKSVSAIWADIKDTTNVDILDAFATQHPGTVYASLAQEKIQGILDDDSKGLAEWQKWAYWKDRGIWQDGDRFCDSLKTFLDNTTRASRFVLAETKKPLNIENFVSGKLDGNFFMRAENSRFPRRFCQSGERADYKFISCSRAITKSALVYDQVIRRTINDLRTCLKPNGWIEFTDKDHDCSAKALTRNKSCDLGFSRGPQDIWLYAVKNKDLERFEIGMQFELETTSDRRVIQGKYEFVGSELIVTSARRKSGGTVASKYDRNGKVISRELQPENQVIKYTYDKSDKVIFVQVSNPSEKISIEYDMHGRMKKVKSSLAGETVFSYNEFIDKPSVVEVQGIGRVVATYSTDGKIQRTTVSPSSAASQIISHLDNLLDKTSVD
jgi:hypothetical protein